jgi:DNA-binding CsgD family transcriptional regulator/PAS domain-containing protein
MSLADDVIELVGQIYEAAVEPRGWDATLMRLGERFRANGGILATTVGGSNQLSFSSEFGAEPAWQARYNQEFYKPELNPLFPAFRRLRPGLAAADWMMLPKQNLMRSAFYNEWSAPQDRHAYLGLVTSAGPQSVGAIMLCRDKRSGDFADEEVALLQALSPHLVRAVGLSRHLGALEGKRQLSEALLDVAAKPVIVVEPDGRIVQANHAAWRILDAADGLLVHRDRLAAARPADTSAVRRRIRAAAERELAACETMAVMRCSGALPYSVAMTPVPIDAVGLERGRVLVAVFVADPHANPPDMVSVLQTAYGLTPAEASLVELLAQDTPSLVDAADRLGVSQTTVKTHLKHCYQKTGAQRQTELIRLALASATGLHQRPD